jgi:hypothetical protein
MLVDIFCEAKNLTQFWEERLVYRGNKGEKISFYLCPNLTFQTQVIMKSVLCNDAFLNNRGMQAT